MSSKSSFLLKEQFSDVQIKVRPPDGYVWKFPAHSLILRATSEWFAETLDEQALVSPEQLSITFADVSHDAVIHLLRYIYTEEFPHLRSPESVLELLRLSVQCRMWPLQALCESKVQSFISVRNAGYLLEKATDLVSSGYGSTVVVEVCRRVVLEYGQIIFSSEPIFHLGLKTMQNILQLDNLNVVDEDTIFSGLWHWGQRRCCRKGLPVTDQNIAQCLAAVLPHVRFLFIKNKSKLPDVISEQYNKCLKAELADNSCCFRQDPPTPRCRQEFRLPRDLIRQSSRCPLFDNWKPREQIPGISRVQCAQVSFEEDVFLTAAEIIAVQGSGGGLSLAIIAEGTGIEMHREDVMWDEARISDKDQLVSSVVKFHRPVPVPRRTIYSLYIVLPSTDCDDGWRFPASKVLRRKHLVRTDEGPIGVTVHSDTVQATVCVYFLLAGQHL